MKKKSKESKKGKEKFMLPVKVIMDASAGDVTAINLVLDHYKGYIAALSLCSTYDEWGNRHYWVDETLRRRLETKLITKILEFKVE